MTAHAAAPVGHTPMQAVTSFPWQKAVFTANGAQELNILTLAQPAQSHSYISPHLCYQHGVISLCYCLLFTSGDTVVSKALNKVHSKSSPGGISPAFLSGILGLIKS